jgi:hypothetical protein
VPAVALLCVGAPFTRLPVIGTPFVGITQYFVGLLDFQKGLETSVAMIRMIGLSQSAIGGVNVIAGRPTTKAENQI